MVLNKDLIIKQNLSDEEVEQLESLHRERVILEHLIETSIEEDIKSYANLHLENNRELQKAWKFEVDDKYYRFWDLPKCGCPKMDNDDNYPSGYYYKNNNCLLHGNFI